MDISSEALSTQDTIHISNHSQEEGRRGPWSWKVLIQHCRGLPGQRSGRGLIGEQAEVIGLMGLMGKGEPGKGNHLDDKQRI